MSVEFTAHNIRLDDGSFTRSGAEPPMDENPWFVSVRRLLETVFPGDKAALRIADLGCLEGGYAVEFARMGFESVGIEVRESNIAACEYVKARTNLPKLSFVRDNALNVEKHGRFDAVFCCGLLYHFNRPRAYIETLGRVAQKLLVLQTHFAPVPEEPAGKFALSPLCENEGMLGRWFPEFPRESTVQQREQMKWASWDNWKSFWLTRENLLQALNEAGFDLVLEQFDSLGPNIAEGMRSGYYYTDSRGTFVGVKTRST